MNDEPNRDDVRAALARAGLPASESEIDLLVAAYRRVRNNVRAIEALDLDG